jgi:hypothetical protein
MYVRWQKRKRRQGVFYAAILVENVRVKGKPTQRHIAYLGGCIIKHAAQRPYFWDGVLARLKRLGNRITPVQRAAIIAALASKVPGPPTTKKQHPKRR